MSERLDGLLKIIFDRLFREGPDGTEPSVLAISRLEEISRAVVRLSELYTRERTDLRHNLLQEPDLRLAYLAYFLPSNFLKINAILEEIWLHAKVKTLLPQRLRILDLGCGPGTQLLGCLDFLSQQFDLGGRGFLGGALDSGQRCLLGDDTPGHNQCRGDA